MGIDEENVIKKEDVHYFNFPFFFFFKETSSLRFDSLEVAVKVVGFKVLYYCISDPFHLYRKRSVS